MENKEKQAFINWSSGKDATYSLFKVLQDKKIKVKFLFTTVNKANHRVSMHGVREELLKQQSRQIEIPLRMLYLSEQTDLPTYNQLIEKQIQQFSNEGISHALFGDIFQTDLKEYREKQLAPFGIKAVFPFWNEDSSELIRGFLEAGFKTVETCVNARLLDKTFAGRILDHEFLDDLPAGVDPCGENGEFHTFVFDGPLFRAPVKFKLGECVEKNYLTSSLNSSQWDTRFYFLDLLADPT